MDEIALPQRWNQHCFGMVLKIIRCRREEVGSQKHQLPKNSLGRKRFCLLNEKDLEEDYAVTHNT